MPIPKFLTNIIGGKASDIVTSLGGVVDKFVQTKEEKDAANLAIQEAVNKHLEAMEVEATKQLEIVLKDIDSARNREIQIATSEKAPLLNKIIAPLLAILILGSCFLFWYFMLFVEIPKDKEVMIAGVVGSLTTLSMGVVGYYFGSSQGSANKQKQLDSIMNR